MEESLWCSSANNRLDSYLELLQSHPGLDVNWKLERAGDDSPLHIASFKGHWKMVLALLRHPDADINPRNKFGETPLLACWNGKKGAVKVLLKNARVDSCATDLTGNTPLWWAASNGHVEVIKLMIASGRELDLDKPGKGEKTALERAVEEGKVEAAELLRKFQADPEKTRQELKTKLGLEGRAFLFLFSFVIEHLGRGDPAGV